MHLQYELENNDYVSSTSIHSPNAVARLSYGFIALQLTMTIVSLAIGNFQRLPSWQGLLAMGLQIIIWLGIIEIQKFFYRRRLRSAWEDDSHMSKSVIADIDDAGVTFQEPYSTTHQPWESFRKVHESTQVFLLFVSKRRFYMMPKRAFLDAAAMGVFRDLVTQKLPSNRYKLKE